jgi:hypothetical protein
MWNGLCFSAAGGRYLILATVDMYIEYSVVCTYLLSNIHNNFYFMSDSLPSENKTS